MFLFCGWQVIQRQDRTKSVSPTVAYLGFGKGGHGERAEREPITGVWGRSPQRGPGQSPWSAPLKLTHFLLLNVQLKPQICPFFWNLEMQKTIKHCWILQFLLKNGKNAPFHMKPPVKNFHGRAKGGGIAPVSYTHLTLPTNREV